jgi:hypothetical protein
MIELLLLIFHIMASLFKPRAKLVAEILVLRQQLNVLRRQVSKRPQLSNTDRFLFVWLYRWFPSVLSAIRAAHFLKIRSSCKLSGVVRNRP